MILRQTVSERTREDSYRAMYPKYADILLRCERKESAVRVRLGLNEEERKARIFARLVHRYTQLGRLTAREEVLSYILDRDPGLRESTLNAAVESVERRNGHTSKNFRFAIYRASGSTP